MATEVEVKAWLADYDAARARVEAEAPLVREVTTRDLYYASAKKPAHAVDLASDPVFRLRNEGDDDAWIVTVKSRSIDDGVEANREVEFRVDDVAAFREFAQHVGFRPFIVKRKQSRRYAVGRATVELNRVDPLGDFMEIEILLEDDAPREEVKEAEKEVRGLLGRFGVPESKIEPRMYIDLLRARGTGRPPGGA